MRMFPLVLIASASLLAGGDLCHAQWTDDPAANTPIATAGGEQVQPKIIPTDDGGAYISWFDNRTGGYDVYLQRINAAGEAQWAEDGILIADRSFSSTQDYDLTVDNQGHAVVAFRDDRFGGIVVTAARVAPDGTQVWGANGVQPSMTGSFIGAIRVAATTDDHVVVGWFNGAAARVVKLDQAGNELWSTDIGSSPAGSFTVSDLVASDAPKSSGQVVVLMTTFGSFITPRHLYAQKLDADGNMLWAAPAVAIHTGSSLQIGNFPDGQSDGNGGLVTAWYETSPLQCRVQHVNSSGAVQYGAGGAVVSTNDSQLRVSPSVAYDAAANESYVFWRELAGNQAPIGVYGQKFSASGVRQWTDSGIAIFLSANEAAQVNTLLHKDGAQVYFAESTAAMTQRIVGMLVDSAGGQETLSEELIEISVDNASKSRLSAMLNTNNQAVLVWQDGRNGDDDLFAQNVNSDGSLGPIEKSPLGDLNGDGVVDVSDLLLLLSDWGACTCDADLNDDGAVDVSDLLILLANWG